jgi:hypothetical protein
MNTPSILVGLVLSTSIACLGPKLKADFEADLNRWSGGQISEFIQAKGDPTQIKPRPQGGKVYVFLTHTPSGNWRDTEKFANADGSLGEASMTMGGARYCRLILETDALGTILTIRWEGNDCW